MRLHAPAELVTSLCHILEDADGAVPVSELLEMYEDAPWKPKTISEVIRTLTKFGAVRMIGSELELTHLGAVWIHQDELPPVPQPRKKKEAT